MNRPFPSRIFRHASLTPAELAMLYCVDHEELSKSACTGLVALVEALVAERTPGYHCEYQITNFTGAGCGFALASHLLHLENGFSADEIEKGRKWLAFPHPPLDKLLLFFLKLRLRKRDHQLTRSVNRAA
jgi:hypothetical protein